MRNILFLTLILPFSSYASEDVFTKMDEKTAVTTGIYKLSSTEKAALSNWLQNSQGKTREKIKQEVRAEVKKEVRQEVTAEVKKKQKKSFMGFNLANNKRDEIKSSINENFGGWRGNTVFKLANGQVWKQNEKTTFYIPKKTGRSITIKPKSFDSWTLFVDGYSKGVKVKRIK